MRFALSYNAFMRVLGTVLGLGPARSGVWVESGTVRVKMGWAFDETVDRAHVVGAEPVDHLAWWWGQGVHGWRGKVVVNGSNQGLVRLRFAPGVRAGSIVRFALREVVVSVEDPAGLVSALTT